MFAFSFIIIVALISCVEKKENKAVIGNNTNKLISEYLLKGREISLVTQNTLLANVSQAMKKSGAEYAIQFCNIKASGLTDSISVANNCKISRVSDKNRNEGNNLKDDLDKSIMNYYNEKINTNKSLNDTIVYNDNGVMTYYNAIKIAMSACLKCHGEPKIDIAEGVLNKINQLYPNDLAKGYKLGDLRGLWKIEFDNNTQQKL